jgi:hypothetical protein
MKRNVTSVNRKCLAYCHAGFTGAKIIGASLTAHRQAAETGSNHTCTLYAVEKLLFDRIQYAVKHSNMHLYIQAVPE